jgi:cadmium resistance protein CadD (predicted permease)
LKKYPFIFFKDKLALLKGIEELWEKFEKIIMPFLFYNATLGYKSISISFKQNP